MYVTIFKIAWPYLQRFLVKRGAEEAVDYLQRRRELRLKKEAGEELPETSVGEPMECPPNGELSSGDAFWFTLSGVLLGGALGVVLSQLIRQDT